MRSKVKRGRGRLALLTRNRTVSALAWSLPAGPLHCRAFLAGSNSVCSMGYAGGGMFLLPSVQRAMARRARWWRDGRGLTDDKVAALVRSIGRASYVVVHVSGDFWEPWEIEAWKAVALLCPHTRFWIRTRTWRLQQDWLPRLERLNQLPNVCVRLSRLHIESYVPAIDVGAPLPVSTVTRDPLGACPKQTEGSCGRARCRACWDKKVSSVTYHLHADAVVARRGSVDWRAYSEGIKV